MRKLVLRNNRGTTLTGALAANATTFDRTLLAQNIIGDNEIGGEPFFGVWGMWELVATLTDDVNTEIIAIVMYQQNDTAHTYTIERGKEGTTPRAWGAGAKFEFRLTAGMLQRLAQQENIGHNYSEIEYRIAQEVNQPAGGTVWAASATIFPDTIRFLKNGADYTYALISLRRGTTGGVTPAPGALAYGVGVVSDLQVLWWYIRLNSNGTISGLNGQRLANLSGTTDSFNAGITIGNNIRQTGDSGLVFGKNNRNYGHQSMVLGSNLDNFGDNALILSTVGVSSSVQNINNGFVISNIPAKPQGLSYVGAGKPFQVCQDGIIWSPIINFAGGDAWTANTPLQHGEIRRPTVANGRQYIWYDNNYNPTHGHTQGGYSFGLTGPTQPIWPTNLGAYVGDGNGSWGCVPNTLMDCGLGSTPFLVKEMGILIHEYQSVTAQPFVSLGNLGSSGNIIANTQTTQLNSPGRAQIFTLASPQVYGGIQFSINTLATGAGARMIGQFWLRGHIVPAYR